MECVLQWLRMIKKGRSDVTYPTLSAVQCRILLDDAEVY